MSNEWLDRWNNRYQHPEYAYGTTPNLFLKEQLSKFNAGSILFAAEGEGRNAVFAALNGWSVSAFDISKEGKNKALQLAEQNSVRINYQVGELSDIYFNQSSFDVIALIFAHFPSNIKSDYHKRLVKLLKPEGIIIFEAFSKRHLPLRHENPEIGGPDNLDDLFSIEELQSDFSNLSFGFIEEQLIELNEGLYHRGIGSVIRFVAKKNNL